MTDMSENLSDEKKAAGNDSTDMAVLRTLMAADRSLMAWVRTGLSLITFGFTLYKFLEYSRERLLETGSMLATVSGPKTVGLFMIGVGILCLILGTAENMAIVKGLHKRHDFKHNKYSLLMAGIILIFGIVLFLGVLLRIQGIGSS